MLNVPLKPVQLFLLPIIVILFTLIVGCEKAENPDDILAFSEQQTCEGCHTNEAMLKQLATPEPPPPPSGES